MTDTKNSNLITRPPIVVVMGHVDHGKTLLLDFIRKTNVVEGETGGITQHIGAYDIEYNGKKITFIDTPGHESFSAMRSRGAKVADIAILVVAADEGVKAQTKEAILHINEAKIPVIVVINKMDKPESNPEKVKRELVVENIVVESMAGKIPSIEVSAKTGKGVNDLLELILLLAEMEDLKADVSMPAEGIVIEAFLDSLRGPVVTLIIQSGILKAGTIIGTESAVGKLKKIENFKGEVLSEAQPSLPVVSLGFEQVPMVGERFVSYPDFDSAKAGIKKSKDKDYKTMLPSQADQTVINLILKADVVGSIEAVEQVLRAIPQEKVALKILKKEVGAIDEADIQTAIGAKARIIGFRVKASPAAQGLAERNKVRIIIFDLIYELAQSVRDFMTRSVEPDVIRTNFGRMKAMAIFMTEKNRQIVGGKVIEGEARKGASLEVNRNDEKVGAGRVINLQRNKKDADKVGKGDECGILYEGNVQVQDGDILVFFSEERKKGEL